MKRGAPLKKTPFKKKPIQLQLRKKSSLQKHRKATDQKIIIDHLLTTLWSLRFSDYQFSLWIRGRDGKCMKCGSTENLTNSHFHRRGNNATRFFPDNCDTFCLFCHAEWESEKAEGKQYYLWKLNQLGEKRFKKLNELAKTTLPQYEAIKNVMIFIAQNPINNNLEEISI